MGKKLEKVSSEKLNTEDIYFVDNIFENLLEKKKWNWCECNIMKTKCCHRELHMQSVFGNMHWKMKNHSGTCWKSQKIKGI